MPTIRDFLAGAAAPCPASVPTLQGTCVYAIGGADGTPDYHDTVEAYSPATNTWATLPSMPTARAFLTGAAAPCPASVPTLQGTCVYAIGGDDGSDIVSTVEAYSPATDTWETLPSMPTARYSPAGAAAPCPAGLTNTCVYAIGGDSYSGFLDTAEAYAPATNTWVTLPSMPTARSGPAGAAAPCPEASNGPCVYVVGGEKASTGSLSDFVNTAEAFAIERASDPQPPLPCPHGPHGKCPPKPRPHPRH
ncbi:kelch repeat-containing protein [Streptomyces sp. NPDC048636]|uniref:Kelch repeat-containing protein n=1 Tax=Streptomyces sp. NPDC048636 TaxID=3155762 RepID=UPI00342E2140